jgi:hypothetical protein
MTVHGFPGYAPGSPLPTLVQVLNGEKPANTPAIVVDTIPGTNWRYSGGGFVVTQLLLQDVSESALYLSSTSGLKNAGLTSKGIQGSWWVEGMRSRPPQWK